MVIIDGHNLIGSLPGVSLTAIDDEEQLIGLLQVFARVKRKPVDVFFDGAPPGSAGVRRYGFVTAHYVAAGIPADEAIRRYLVQLGGRARGATVVTSDRQVQANARALHASVTGSDVFARELGNLDPGGPSIAPRSGRKPGAEPSMSLSELEDWYDMFGLDAEQAERPIEPPPAPLRQPKRKGKKKPH